MGRKKNTDDDSMAVDPNDFPKKWLKKLPENWTEGANAMDNDTLKKRVVEWEQAISTMEKDLEADDEIAKVKEDLKEKMDVYKAPISEHQAMIRYAVFLLNSRGQVGGQ